MDDDSESERENLECDDSGKVSEDFDSYIEHRGIGVSFGKNIGLSFNRHRDRMLLTNKDNVQP